MSHSTGTSEELLPLQGWKRRDLAGFIGTTGPLWTRRDDSGWRYGLLVEERHLNPAGVMHGGALCTLLDHVISTVAWEACDRTPCVTLQLDSQFLAAVKAGQFIEASATLEHRTKGMVFMRGRVEVDGAAVMVGQAILKIVNR
ncbi:MAG: PaaI family thioesterase [Hydrogenophaga sp.]|nr:PaaI family thioesterase [Hydrogenophaga sp.]